MTCCEKCIHYDICKIDASSMPDDFISYFPYNDDCGYFKSAADMVEIRHGKWANKGNYAVCTECGERSSTQYDGVEPIPLMTKFCPNCGAKMDERSKK